VRHRGRDGAVTATWRRQRGRPEVAWPPGHEADEAALAAEIADLERFGRG
jgi:hypothetical protein